jgi:hypothetical protein
MNFLQWIHLQEFLYNDSSSVALSGMDNTQVLLTIAEQTYQNMPLHHRIF